MKKRIIATATLIHLWASPTRADWFGYTDWSSIGRGSTAIRREGGDLDGNLTYGGALAAARTGHPIVIRNSSGGSMAGAHALVGHRVIVDGPCFSACAWSFAANPKACFTPNASLGFHTLTDARGVPMLAATRGQLAHLPGGLQKRVGAVASGQVHAVWIDASTIRAYYPHRACK